MIFIETEIFTKVISELMSEDEYAAMQAALIENPEKGQEIGGGLRKMRWASDEGKGKRGGARVIYYWLSADKQIRMLYAYRKAKQEDLTPEQVKLLRQILNRW